MSNSEERFENIHEACRLGDGDVVVNYRSQSANPVSKQRQIDGKVAYESDERIVIHEMNSNGEVVVALRINRNPKGLIAKSKNLKAEREETVIVNSVMPS